MIKRDAPVLGIVVPCFNEEQVLPLTAHSLQQHMLGLIERGLVSAQSWICFVDDGSRDHTWPLIEKLAGQLAHVRGLKLSRNFGHQSALYAGLMEHDADVFVSIDADLQDDIAAIEQMLAAHARGSEIVYGVRDNRDSDSWWKRTTAELHYRLLGMMGVESVPNHADFRLMSRRAVAFLGEYRESNLYLRGIVPLLGLRSENVYYTRRERPVGETKYSLARMLGLSLRGMTSFSVLPLRLISALGLVVFVIALLMGLWAIIAVFSGAATVPGWASTVIPIYLLGGLQLLSIGIAGEYIGKIFTEAKKRPLYQVEARLDTPEKPL